MVVLRTLGGVAEDGQRLRGVGLVAAQGVELGVHARRSCVQELLDRHPRRRALGDGHVRRGHVTTAEHDVEVGVHVQQRQRLLGQVEQHPMGLDQPTDARVLTSRDGGDGADDDVATAHTEAVHDGDGRVEVERRFLGAVGVQLEEPHVAFIIGRGGA